MSVPGVGGPCPECGGVTVATGAYWPATEEGPSKWDISCTNCGWKSSASDDGIDDVVEADALSAIDDALRDFPREA